VPSNIRLSHPAWPLLVAGLLCAAAPLDAKRIYSYRDANGVMHFSDRPPQEAASEVQETLVEVDRKRLVFLREEGTDADKRFSLWNGYGGPIEVQLRFESAVNVVSEPDLPARVVIPGQATSLVLQVQPIDQRIGWTYQWSYGYLPGDPAARHDPAAVYRLPFDESLRLRVDQAFGGSFSHAEAHSYHAVDIAMDEGTPVLAARAGTVMAVESDFFGSGQDIQKYGDRANHIRIVHPDGTMAVYAHLALESVLVAIGDRVRAGQEIARSGNTGFSTGPHLHFVIQRNAGGKLVSEPFAFTAGGQVITPTQGSFLGGQGTAASTPR
jgi:murein DD-endopeptidase MepM/ murein hydrolase activator NlpD